MSRTPGGNGDDLVKAAVVQFCQLGHELFGIGDVDFVHRQELGTLHLRQFRQNLPVVIADEGAVHHGQHRVHAFLCVLGGFHHVFAQAGAGLMQTGGIHKDDLPVLAGGHAQQLGTGGLGVIGHDGDLFADKIVHDAGLAHVGPAQDGYKAASEFGHVFISCSKIKGICPGLPGRRIRAAIPKGSAPAGFAPRGRPRSPATCRRRIR